MSLTNNVGNIPRRELGGMLGSPGGALDAMNGAGELKYPADCYSPKFSESYKGKAQAIASFIDDSSLLAQLGLNLMPQIKNEWPVSAAAALQHLGAGGTSAAAAAAAAAAAYASSAAAASSPSPYAQSYSAGTSNADEMQQTQNGGGGGVLHQQ